MEKRLFHVKAMPLRDVEDETFYTFNTPIVTDKGGYRQIMSLSAFFQSMKSEKRNMNKKHGTYYFLYNEEDVMCLREQREYLGKAFGVERPILVQEHFGSLWDFYEFIGWDHKKKKYK